MMQRIKANEPDEPQDPTASSDDTGTEERDLSEWEKRLEGMK